MDYQAAYDSLAGQYQPQADLINTQIAQLAPQEQAVQASLDQAKVNAFKDITNQSNARGVLFSGVPIDQQSTYVGTKYLPAVAQNKTAFQNSRNTLTGQLNELTANRQKQAQDSVFAYQKQQADDAYRQQQLALQYAKVGSSGSGKTPSQAQIKQQDMAVTAQNLQSKVGRDGHVSQETWNKAIGDWLNAGYSAQDFVKSNIQFVNQRYGGYHGYN